MFLRKPLTPRTHSLAAVFHRYLSTAATAATAAIGSEKKPHFMVDYLISSCGLSSAEASKASKYLSHLRSTKKPDSFLGFMRSHGFDDTQLRRIISCRPKLVTYDVDKTLAPKFHSLQSLGFTASDLTSLIASDPSLLHSKVDSALLQRIRFWESLLGSRDCLFKVLKLSDVSLLSGSVEESALPNLSLLQSCGVSEEQIGSMLRKNPRIILRKPEDVRALVEQVEQMGIPKSSGMFIWGFYALNLVSKARLNANLELMKSFGWSKADFLSVFCRTPSFATLPRKSLSNKMNFLVKEVGMDPLAVASAPMLLLHSLERRLIPRHHIIRILKSRKLLDRKYKLITVVGFPDKVFMEKYVTPYKDKVPELEEIEIA